METGPLELLAGERVLAVADAQNLNMGARDLGRKVSWKALGTILDRAAARIERHVVLSAPQGEDRRTQYFAERGWTAHVKQSRMVRNHKGWQRISNADGLLLFVTGMLAANSDASLVLVCSGDGELVEEVAEALYLQGLPLRVATLEPGRLDLCEARCRVLFAGRHEPRVGRRIVCVPWPAPTSGNVSWPRACLGAAVQTWVANRNRTKTRTDPARTVRRVIGTGIALLFCEIQNLCELR